MRKFFSSLFFVMICLSFFHARGATTEDTLSWFLRNLATSLIDRLDSSDNEVADLFEMFQLYNSKADHFSRDVLTALKNAQIDDLMFIDEYGQRLTPKLKIPEHADPSLKDLMARGNIIDLLSRCDLSQSRPLKLLTDPSTKILGNTRTRTLLQKTIPKFYKAIPWHYKARIYKRLLRLPMGASEELRLYTMIENSGPVIQKIFQLYGNSIDLPEFKSLSPRLKNQLPPISFSDIERILWEDYSLYIHDMFEDFQREPFAAVSVAQIHRANLKQRNKQNRSPSKSIPVAVKIIRPRFTQEATEDFDILDQVVDTDLEIAIIKQLRKSILPEGFTTNEVTGIREGQVYRDPINGIDVVSLAPGTQPTHRVIIMSWMNGESLSRLTADSTEQLIKRYQVLMRLYRRWFERALAQDGFFHGDPHGENLLIRPRVDHPTELDGLFLDFGNHGKLSQQQQIGFALLAATSAFDDAQGVAHAIEILQNRTPLETALKSRLIHELEKILMTISDANEKIDRIFELASNLGIPLPSGVTDFQRARLLFRSERLAILNELEKRNSTTLNDPRVHDLNFDIIEADIMGNRLANTSPDDCGLSLVP